MLVLAAIAVIVLQGCAKNLERFSCECECETSSFKCVTHDDESQLKFKPP